MLNKLSNILAYLGITLLLGYSLWLLKQQDMPTFLIGVLTESGVFFLLSLYFSKKDSKKADVCTCLSLITMTLGMFFFFDNFSSWINIETRIQQIIVYFVLTVYISLIYLEVYKSKLVSFTSALICLLFPLSVLSYLLHKHIPDFDVSSPVMILVLTHFLYLEESLMPYPVRTFYNSLNYPFEKFPKLKNGLLIFLDLSALFFISINQPYNSIGKELLYLVLFALLVGSFIVLNNSRKYFHIVFWLLIISIFSLIARELNLPTSTFVLLAGIGLVIISLVIKRFSKYTEVIKKISGSLPESVSYWKMNRKD